MAQRFARRADTHIESFLPDRLSSRCLVHLEGLEWFLYNRSPAFDAIVDRMKAANEGKVPQDNKQQDASSSDEDVATGEPRSENGTDDLLEKIDQAEQRPPGKYRLLESPRLTLM